MGPGPCNPYPEVTLALGRPMLGHLDPDFIAVLDETSDRLRQVFRTSNGLTFPISATGSAGMEASFVNFVRPGQIVVIGVNGVFGERMVDVAGRCGAEVVRVDVPWGRPIDPQQLADAHPSPAIIAVVHAETSTGVRNDVEPLGELKGEALLLVDCVTSLGGIPLEIDGWGIDIAYSGTQKCLGCPPGLSPMTVSDRARSRLLEKPSSWYLDLNMIAKYVSGEGARAYHHTAPITAFYALHEGLSVIADEGLENRFARHRKNRKAFVAGIEAMGMEMHVADGHRLWNLMTPKVPAGISDMAIRKHLMDKHGIEIAGGLGELAGKAFRIGLMGVLATEKDTLFLLEKFEEALRAHGFEPKASAVPAAKAVYAAA